MPVLMNLQPTIPGESQITGYANWHALTFFAWGGTRVMRSQSAGSARGQAQIWTPQVRNVTVHRLADGQTAAVWTALYNRTQFPKVTIEWVRTGDGEPVSYFTVEMKSARMVSVRDNSTGSHPIEEIEFLYTDITLGTRNVGNRLTGAQDLVTYSVPKHAGG